MSNLNVEDQGDIESKNQLVSCHKDAEIDTSQVQKEEIKETVKSEEQSSYTEHYNRALYYKMYIFCREFCFIMLLVFTYAAFQNNTPKVSKSPTAFPFFPVGSIVKDWYRGQLGEAIELASESDLAFVMYYAPWDAESQAVKNEFNIVAQHMHKYIHFAAINCWQPGSECRQQYSKVYSWPVLMAYPAHGRGIHYRGPRTVEHMLRFLQSVANPLTRITNIVQVSEYRALHEAVIVGYLDPKLGSSDYGVFYSTSLRFLERDPMRQIPFLVVTGVSTAHSFLNYDFPSLQLYLWNETLEYPKEKGWRSEAITTWIGDHLHQVISWASLPGGKSQSLANYLQPGPALILFTPKNPLYSHIDYYSILHHVALEYYNCRDSINVNILKSFILFFQKEYKIAYENLKNRCLANKKNFPTILTYDLPKMWINNTCDFKKTDTKFSVCLKSNIKLETCDNVIVSSPQILNKEAYNEKSKSHKNHSTNTNRKSISISMLTGENDSRSPANLQKLAEHEKCHLFRIAYKLQPALFPKNVAAHDVTQKEITGLACKTNLTLSILALDSIQHHHFAEGLGIDILNKEDKSAVVILNPAFETHHVMKGAPTMANLRKFIADFTNSALVRTLSSAAIPREHTHQYKYQNCQTNISVTTCMQELTTDTFLPTVMQTDKAVIVLYYSVKCAFCSGVSHIFLTTARKLSQVKNIYFTRIDGDNHALPWEFAMHHYPTILFFPTRRKSDSRVFPQSMRITVANIISFILANVEANMKLHVMWTLCKETKYPEDLEKCSQMLRIECISLIGNLLKIYRYSTDIQQRNIIMKYLQTLRDLHFSLASPSTNNLSIIQKHIDLLRPFEINRIYKSDIVL